MASVAPSDDEQANAADQKVLLRKQTSHFADSSFMGAEGETDNPALYKYLLAQPEFSAGRVASGLFFLFVMQLVLVLAALGLGQWGNGCSFAIACMLVNWSTLAAIWEEGKHVSLFRPGTPTFYGFALAHMVLEAFAYGLQNEYVIEPDDDDTTEDAGTRFQGSVILAYFLRYIVAGVGFTYMLMFQAHKDASQHLFRVCFCVIAIGSFVYRAFKFSGVAALQAVSGLFQYVFYFGAILVGVPIAVFKLDEGKRADEVSGGTACLVQIEGTYAAVFAFYVAGLDLPGFIKAAILSGFTGMLLSALTPAARRAYGKEW